MRSATSDGIRRTCVLVLLLAVLTLPAGPRTGLLAEPPVSDNQNERLTGVPDTEGEGPAEEEQRRGLLHTAARDVMRTLAWISLCIILLLIIFVVVVMILNRRLRIRYLGWDRKIKFSKLWDVWWQKSEEGPDEKGKPDKK